MPIDPSGTAPGLAEGVVEQTEIISMKCKRPECQSNQAIEVLHPGTAMGRRLYRCVRCHTSWGVTTGGPVEL